MRKRWTPKTEITDSLLKFREKRKWQIALRRYVLEGNPSMVYAPYFGLDAKTFRKWIELQFNDDLNWENFSAAWQLDHIVPVAYFDFSVEEDLRLCWSFINIRVERLGIDGGRVDVLAAKAYFDHLFKQTGLFICRQMVEKIERIESSQIQGIGALEGFLKSGKDHIETVSSFGMHELARLNEGIPINEIKAEMDLLKKFGGE